MTSVKIQYLALIFALCLGSCSSNKSNPRKVVRFGLNDKMCLAGKEQLQPSSKSEFIEYEQNCLPSTMSIPLNRVIDAGNYQIYIGIPITSALDKVSTAMYKHFEGKVLEKREDTRSKEAIIKSAYLYNYQLIHKTKSKNVFVFNLVSKDESLVRKFYAEKYLIKKLNCEKKKQTK